MFDTVLTLSTGSAIDSSVFTYTDATLTQALSLLYTVNTYPSLLINTSDLAKKGTVEFKITTSSHSTLGDTLNRDFLFSV